MHEKKRKRKLKEEEASGEANIRRPFDRDIDLKVGFLDSFFFTMILIIYTRTYKGFQLSTFAFEVILMCG